MDSIAKILKLHIKDKKVARNVYVARVLRCFDETINDLFSDKSIYSSARALFLKNRVLAVGVKSHVISQELRFVEEDIIRLVNERMGKDMVGGIMYILK